MTQPSWDKLYLFILIERSVCNSTFIHNFMEGEFNYGQSPSKETSGAIKWRVYETIIENW